MHLVDAAEWSRRRDEAYRRFLEDIEVGYVDRDVVELIRLVFSKKRIFTTSSCSGRITIVDAAYPWLRDEAYVLFKKHEPVDPSEIEPIIASRPIHRYWLVVSGPIIHFILASLEDVQKLFTALRESGFKHSGVISITSAGVVVEAVSGVWTPFLLKDGDHTTVVSLQHVVGIANSILAEGKNRLGRLLKAFKELEI
ncbi:MAG: hypothetical protein N3D82_03335 [Ignisphaera sp.]|nr:hypothetical protein [Ignisphaera sp.]MCX8168043.1 hypothetical protein [Ignisphaera sp.]MDW8085768.1 hypothetical protein [Ignisphaera sp.]